MRLLLAWQVFFKASDDLSYLDYESEECDTELSSFFHDMSQMEWQGNWARCWCRSSAPPRAWPHHRLLMLISCTRVPAGPVSVFQDEQHEHATVSGISSIAATV